MSYALWRKRATKNSKLERQLFKQGCFWITFCLLKLEASVSSCLAVLILSDATVFRKSVFFLCIAGIAVQILRKCPCDGACSVILAPNMNVVCHKMAFFFFFPQWSWSSSSAKYSNIMLAVSLKLLWITRQWIGRPGSADVWILSLLEMFCSWDSVCVRNKYSIAKTTTLLSLFCNLHLLYFVEE